MHIGTLLHSSAISPCHASWTPGPVGAEVGGAPVQDPVDSLQDNPSETAATLDRSLRHSADMDSGGGLCDVEDLQPQPKAADEGLDKGRFNWNKAWYPLAPAWYLDKGRPHGQTVLGHRLVVWWDVQSGSWRCFEDKCPHRLAPLSEGRIEPATGQLQCSYHGWRFDGGGRCRAVLQADSERQLAVVCSSRRSCVASYPVREEHGMLWIWLDSRPGGAEESAARRVALPSEVEDGSGVLLGEWYMRDLPVSYEYLLENLVDPSHIHWAHHGVIGDRSRAVPLKLELEGDVSAHGGFTLLFHQRIPSAMAFIPPSLTWLKLRPGEPKRFSLLFYAVPVAPGHSRIFAGYSTTALPPFAVRILRSRLLVPVLRGLQWLQCHAAHEVLDGDTLFIRQQEANALADGRGWKTTYFMPAAADRGVAVLRRWLEREGDGGPVYGPYAQPLRALPQMSREQILDRYSQHTQYCPSCRRALRGVRGLRSALSLAATAGLAAGAALLALSCWGLAAVGAGAGRPQPALPVWPQLSATAGSRAPLTLLAAAALAGWGSRALRRLERRFVFTDYVHSEK